MFNQFEFSLNPSRLIHKSPFFTDRIVLRDGGTIETSAGTTIIEVNASTGVPTVEADIEFNASEGIQDNNGNELLGFNVVASATTNLSISNNSTGLKPILSTEGEADIGMAFHNDQSEVVFDTAVVPTGTTHLRLSNNSTGLKPILSVQGEADIGMAFHNDQSEVIFDTVVVPTGTTWMRFSNNSTGLKPVLSVQGEADIGLAFHNDQDEVMASLTPTATATTYVDLQSNTTGLSPIVRALGEADLGLLFQNDQAENMFAMDSVATAVNWVQAANATTGAKPIFSTQGEADIGMAFHNDQSEVIFDTAVVPTGTNWLRMSNNSTGLKPILSTQGEADIGMAFHNDQSEVIFDTVVVATSTNWLRMSNNSTGLKPILSTQGEADIGMAFHNDQSEVIFDTAVVGTGVNWLRFSNNSTGLDAILSGQGEANVNIRFEPKGTGSSVFYSDESGAVGATIDSWQESSSPSVADDIFVHNMYGEDDGDNKTLYAKVNTQILSVTGGSETAKYFIGTQDGSGGATVSANMTLFWDGGLPTMELGDGTAVAHLRAGGSQNLTVGVVGAANIIFQDGAAGDLLLEAGGTGLVNLTSALKTTLGAGTVGTNVTAVEHGHSKNFVTILTLSAVAMGTITSSTSEAFGALIYTFPAGVHVHEVTVASIAFTGGGATKTDQPDWGVGSVIGTGAIAVLNGGTMEDYVTGQTAADINGTINDVGPIGARAGILTGISLNAASDVKLVHLNMADAWAASSGGAATATGTVVLKWSYMA